MKTRLQVSLDGDEADALTRLAACKLRDPREQIRWFVRRKLVKLGLLSPETEQKQAGRAEEAA